MLRSGLLAASRRMRPVASWFETAHQHLCDTDTLLTQTTPQETSHDRLRSRAASHGGRATLVRGFCTARTLRDPEPHHDIGGVRGLPDREWRYPPDSLRCRILPRPWHAG